VSVYLRSGLVLLHSGLVAINTACCCGTTCACCPQDTDTIDVVFSGVTGCGCAVTGMSASIEVDPSAMNGPTVTLTNVSSGVWTGTITNGVHVKTWNNDSCTGDPITDADHDVGVTGTCFGDTLHLNATIPYLSGRDLFDGSTSVSASLPPYTLFNTASCAFPNVYAGQGGTGVMTYLCGCIFPPPTHVSGTIDVSYSASDGLGDTLSISTVGAETFSAALSGPPISTSGSNILVNCSITGTVHQNAVLFISIECRSSDGWYISIQVGTSSEGCGPNINWFTGSGSGDSFVKYANVCDDPTGTFMFSVPGDPDGGGWTGSGSGTVTITIT
jgi:hypothetical protein